MNGLGKTKNGKEEMYHMHDIIIVGGGPAGLTAAIYALRAGKTVLVIEKNSFGGQIAFCVDRYNEGSTMEQMDLRTTATIVEHTKKMFGEI